jgi:hypothetical protein
MFGLDAEVVAPQIATTFTTRDLVGVPVLREAMAQTARKVRVEIAREAKYGGTLEWTTGQTKYSGGHRRPHLHLLWKGLDENDADDVRAIATEVWQRLTGAHSHTSEAIRTPGAAIRYVALHHLKEGQAPPLGFTGRRLWTSLGWWEGGALETRTRARAVVVDERLRRRCERELLEQVPDGLDEGLFDELLAGKLDEARKTRGQVRAVRVREVVEVDHETGVITNRLREVVGDV